MESHNFGRKAEQDLRLFRDLGHAWQTVRREQEGFLAEQGLSLAQFSVLDVLYSQGPRKVGELVEAADSTPGNMTVVLDNLLKSNLIAREQDSQDRRVSLISLSQAGRDLLDRIYPLHILSLQQRFRNLDEREKSALLDLAGRLTRQDI